MNHRIHVLQKSISDKSFKKNNLSASAELMQGAIPLQNIQTSIMLLYGLVNLQYPRVPGQNPSAIALHLLL